MSNFELSGSKSGGGAKLIILERLEAMNRDTSENVVLLDVHRSRTVIIGACVLLNDGALF